MARLPINGEMNWGSILNEYLTVAHNQDGSSRNQMDVINVRDYGVTGDPSQDPAAAKAALQDAMAAGKHIYFPAGTYRFTDWTFDQDEQRVTFAPDAVLKPATNTSVIIFKGNHQVVEYANIEVPQEISAGSPQWPDGLIHFVGLAMIVRNLKIEAHAAITRLVKVSQASDSRFEDLQILAPATVEGIHVTNLTKCTFTGGSIKGGSGAKKTAGSAGLVIGADEQGHSAYEIRAYGLTIHHWETGVRFSGLSHDDPLFFGCSFENNVLYGISFAPKPGSQWGGVIYNLGLFGCHFEGNYQCIHTAADGSIQGAAISGCRFAMLVPAVVEEALPPEKRLPQRVINAQGHWRGVVVSGCFIAGRNHKPDAHIWEVNGTAYNCADIFNYWADMPNGNFATGANSDRVIQLSTRIDSGNGRTLDLNGWFRHHGAALGFYGAAPVIQPGGYTTIAPQSATVADLAQSLNKLMMDLASLGLIKMNPG